MSQLLSVRPRCLLTAFQWDGEERDGYQRIGVGLDELSMPGYNLVVPCYGGDRYAVPGDWITISPAGIPMVWSPAEFAHHYELVASPGELSP